MTAVKGFNEISYDELMDVNGGEFSWNQFVGAMAAGAVGGAMAGSLVGGGGAGPGAVSGALIGGAAYCVMELWNIATGYSD